MPSETLQRSLRALRALLTRRVEIDFDRVKFNYEDVPLKKIINWILVEASISKKPGKPWGLPTHLQIEPSARCNLSCSFCPVTEGMDRVQGNMDPALFKKLIDEIGDYVFLITLWDWGEPFINNNIYEMISYARERGIKLISSTNGHLFAKSENADRVIRSGLDTLIVALDGTTQESYARYRLGGKFDTVIKGIETIVERKRALKSKRPYLNLRFVVMKHNEHEIPEVKKLAASLGVDALTFKTMNPYDETGALTDLKHNEFIPSDQFYRRFKVNAEGARIRRTSSPCKHLWNNPAIHFDGTICPCSFDADEKYKLGDLKTETFKSIWNGKAYRDMRSRFRENWQGINICSECSYAYEGGSCSTETIADAIYFNPVKA